METEKSESQERLNSLYEIALAHHIVKNKSDFAKLLGVHQSNLSIALNNPAGSLQNRVQVSLNQQLAPDFILSKSRRKADFDEKTALISQRRRLAKFCLA